MARRERKLLQYCHLPKVGGGGIARYFEDYLEYLAIFEKFHEFIPRLLVEPVKMFCGTLFGKE